MATRRSLERVGTSALLLSSRNSVLEPFASTRITSAWTPICLEDRIFSCLGLPHDWIVTPAKKHGGSVKMRPPGCSNGRAGCGYVSYRVLLTARH